MLGSDWKDMPQLTSIQYEHSFLGSGSRLLLESLLFWLLLFLDLPSLSQYICRDFMSFNNIVIKSIPTG